jgi:hypothetical protein
VNEAMSKAKPVVLESVLHFCYCTLLSPDARWLRGGSGRQRRSGKARIRPPSSHKSLRITQPLAAIVERDRLRKRCGPLRSRKAALVSTRRPRTHWYVQGMFIGWDA